MAFAIEITVLKVVFLRITGAHSTRNDPVRNIQPYRSAFLMNLSVRRRFGFENFRIATLFARLRPVEGFPMTQYQL